MQRLDFRRKAGSPCVAAPIIEFNNLRQRGIGTVMHVRPEAVNISQTRRLEGAFLRLNGDVTASPWVISRYANIVKAVVCKVPSTVAFPTASLTVEKVKTGLRLLVQYLTNLVKRSEKKR